MPVMACSVNNQPGWKWGDSGKCYVGGDEAKRKAYEQGYAIKASQARGGRKRRPGEK